ncbi:MAG: hypothetical protein ISR58_01575 [Anaerolineales bacterium]|nr:hypothetical protein [Chloroflexota bacterium]MBL6979855.1 hypothetical protein [Anaerolineales bacterium]
MKSIRKLLPFIALSIALASCVFPVNSEPTSSPVPPSATIKAPTATWTLTVTDTLIPPTETQTATQIPPTKTSTSTPTQTPTPIPPAMLVDQNAVCRTGPGTNYPIIGYLSIGDAPAIEGVVEGDLLWWLIYIAEGDKTCWISDNVVTVGGNVTGVPVLTPPPTPTGEPASNIGGDGIYYFMVAENTGGPFGCGDSLLYIAPGIERTGVLEVDITNALNALFSNNYQYYNGLYNPMHASSLRVEDVEPGPAEGETTVWLRGDFAKPKDKCDSLRMRAQVWETIEIQFPDVQHAVIRVHNALLGDLLVTGW